MINKIQKPITLLMLLLMLPFASVGEVVALTVDQSNKNDVVLLDENKKEATEVTTDETGVVDFYAGVTNGDTLRLTTNQPVELSTVDTGLTITPIDQTTYDLSWVKVGSNTSKVKLKTSGDSGLKLKLASKDNESTKTLLIQKALAVTEKTEESVPASESSKDEDTTPSTTLDETTQESEASSEDLKVDESSNSTYASSSMIESSSSSEVSSSSLSSSTSTEESSAVSEIESSTTEILPSKSIVETATPKLKIANARVALAATNFDASRFVTSTTVTDGKGNDANNKTYPDTDKFKITYNLDIGNGAEIDLSQPYTMNLPKPFSFETTKPIRLVTADGVFLGEVSIKDGKISIQFHENVNSLENVKINFEFWSGTNNTQLDYDKGNDIKFPKNDYHINFGSIISSVGG